jgi:hypothetical protein
LVNKGIWFPKEFGDWFPKTLDSASYSVTKLKIRQQKEYIIHIIIRFHFWARLKCHSVIWKKISIVFYLAILP